ncbi:hypothetical protein D7M11_18810 [Paenibacillus ginsengarvi]|uniref:Uncharacterized protein n=1 Tax=Paenibacillus ginsengarvi TaxID=400777 RepID=A0A3B0CFY8_9BACL|nr:hypothetical protein D7M11_18810 [Paenibacillus ginsengarvi]
MTPNKNEGTFAELSAKVPFFDAGWQKASPVFDGAVQFRECFAVVDGSVLLNTFGHIFWPKSPVVKLRKIPYDRANRIRSFQPVSAEGWPYDAAATGVQARCKFRRRVFGPLTKGGTRRCRS